MVLVILCGIPLIFSSPVEAKPLTKYGDTGKTVKEVQSDLKKVGMPVGKIDGIFGNETKKALQKFQKINQLPVTGVVNPTTWNALAPLTTFPNLRFGDRGKMVANLQLDLKKKGDSPGEIDGIFGNETQLALQKFERSHHLPITPNTTPMVWKQLLGVNSTYLQGLFKKNATPFLLTGWVTNTASLQDAQAHISKIQQINLDMYTFTSGGVVIGATPPPFSYSGKVFETVTNPGFNGNVIDQALHNSSVEQTLENNLVTVALQHHEQGVNLDIENLPSFDQKAFNGFIEQLAQKLHRKGLLLNTTVPAETGNNQPYWNSGYNYSVIGKYSDEVSIMAYDYTGSNNAPGPIAPYWWVRSILQYATKTIPKQKILLGVGAFGYNWSTGSSQTAVGESQYNIATLAAQYSTAKIRWDPRDQEPYLTYKDNQNQQHTVYYENQKSLQEKISLAKQFGVRGISLWHFGLENSNFYQLI